MTYCTKYGYEKIEIPDIFKEKYNGKRFMIKKYCLYYPPTYELNVNGYSKKLHGQNSAPI